MKIVHTKIIAAILSITFVVPGALIYFQPHKVEAQAKMSVCLAALAKALGFSIPQAINDFIAVPVSQKSTLQQAGTTAATEAVGFNSCVLQPLAKVMIIALIRNIGSNIVNWVNSGFNGSPTFITDFGGMLFDAADQAVGTFIEGSELGFLCNDFSFRIRIALALKYSSPFRKRATCTLSQIQNNIATNGGFGWDNWLQITTEPQNNVYGAYVIAESELAQRAAKAVGIKEKKTALGQGFLDFETCADDGWETPEQRDERLRSIQVTEDRGEDSDNPFYSASAYSNTSTNVTGGTFTQTNTSYNANSFVNSDSSQYNPGLGSGTTVTNRTVASNSGERQCLKTVTKTPGSIIAGKLTSTFAQGDIQAAVAQEIDDVIAATMNQLARMAITGAQGLLGMNSKKGNTQSYYDKYQNTLYGSGRNSSTIDTGATSPIEDYTIPNYSAAEDLINSDPQTQAINNRTAVVTDQAMAQDQARQDSINSAINSSASTTSLQNLSIFKPARQKSTGGGSASNAVNGIKTNVNIGSVNGVTSDASNYNQPSITGEDQDAWWEVDLGAQKVVSEVRIWAVPNKPVSKTLETIRVIASNDNNQDVWTSAPITPSDSGYNPIVIPVGQTKRYIRIQKQSTLDEQCRAIYEYDWEYHGQQMTWEPCYQPLELAEVEVMGTNPTVNISTSGIVTTSTSNSQTDTTPATSTLAWVTPTSINTVTNTAPLSLELHLTAQKPISSSYPLKIATTLKWNGEIVPFSRVFSGVGFTFGKSNNTQATRSLSPSELSTTNFYVTGVSLDGGSNYYLFKIQGTKSSSGVVGTYTLETTVEDDSGTVYKTTTTDFVVQ